MKTYKYLYYNLYCIWLKKKNEQENASINAVITITFFIYLNIISIPLVLLAIYKREIIQLPEMTVNVKIVLILFLIGLGVVNYFLLARKKQHDKIVKEFIRKENKREGMFFTIVYLIISFGVPFFVFLFTTPNV